MKNMSPSQVNNNQVNKDSDPHSHRWKALGVLSLAQFLIILDTSIIGVALPTIQQHFGFSQADLQWIFNAYVIVFGALLLLGGRLSDIVGQKKIFIIGFLTLTIASVIAGLAPSGIVLGVVHVVPVALPAAAGNQAAVGIGRMVRRRPLVVPVAVLCGLVACEREAGPSGVRVRPAAASAEVATAIAPSGAEREDESGQTGRREGGEDSGAGEQASSGVALGRTSAESLLAAIKASGKKGTLVNAWASWCGPCRMLGPTIDQLAQEYSTRSAATFDEPLPRFVQDLRNYSLHRRLPITSGHASMRRPCLAIRPATSPTSPANPRTPRRATSLTVS